MDEKTQNFIDGLHRARALIATGWTQGSFRKVNADDTLCYCLAGALNEAGVGWWTIQFPRGTRKRSGAIAWNDARGRTQAQVLACLDNSIAALERA